MASFLETQLSKDETSLINSTLKAQVLSYGSVELPLLENLFQLHHCRNVLDIGVGEGSFLLQLAQRNPQINFHGIEQNQLSLDEAAASQLSLNIANVNLHQAFFSKDFPEKKYDAIYTRYTLQHASSAEDFLREVFRRLSPGGLFVAMESFDDTSISRFDDPIWNAYVHQIENVHKKIGSNSNIGRSMGGMLKQAGFSKVNVSVNLISPSTIGLDRFRSVILSTTITCHKLFPQWIERSFVDELIQWFGRDDLVNHVDPAVPIVFAWATV